MNIRKSWQDWVVILFFIIAVYVRVNVDGIYPNNPGNVKAADPVFHTLTAESISEYGKIGYQPPYMAQGREDASNINPQHIPIIVGSAKALTGIEVWNLYYLFVCILSAFSVILLYLVAKQMFNPEIALLASGLLILPLNFEKWYYLLHIGIWPNSTVFTFVLLILLLVMLFIEHKKNIYLLLLGLTTAAIFQIHYSEIILVAPVILFLIIHILKNNEPLKSKFIQLLYLGIIPFAMLLLTLEIYLYSGFGGVTGLLSAGSYGFSTAINVPQYVPAIKDIGLLYGIFLLFAMVQIGINYRKYLPLIGYAAYLSALMFILPYFMKDPYFFSYRTRYYLLFFVLVLVAYGIYYLLKMVIPKTPYIPAVFLAIIIFSALGYGAYSELVRVMSYQNIPEARYQGYEWIQKNTPGNAKIFYFAPEDQKIANWMKRQEFVVDFNKLSDTFIRHNSSTSFPLEYPGRWTSAGSDGGYIAHRTGFLKQEYYPLRNLSENILNCDYIYFENLNDQFVQLNRALAQFLITNYGFTPVYYNNFAIIMKNGYKQ